MRRWLLPICALPLLSLLAWAAIGFVNSKSYGGTSVAVLGPIASGADIFVVSVMRGDDTITAVSDGTANVYDPVKVASTGTATSDCRVEVWHSHTTVALDNTKAFTHTHSGATATWISYVAYSSAVSGYMGANSNTASGTGTALSITTTLADAGNFAVAGFCQVGASAVFSSPTGNDREHGGDGAGARCGLVMDNTGSKSVTTAETSTLSGKWAAASVELLGATGGGGGSTARRRVVVVQ